LLDLANLWSYKLIMT